MRFGRDVELEDLVEVGEVRQAIRAILDVTTARLAEGILEWSDRKPSPRQRELLSIVLGGAWGRYLGPARTFVTAWAPDAEALEEFLGERRAWRRATDGLS